MKTKANNSERNLKEKTNQLVIGRDGQGFIVWRYDANDMRVFIPIEIDGEIDSYFTDEPSNNKLLKGFFLFKLQDGTVLIPENENTDLGIKQILKVGGGFVIQFYAPGNVQGGFFVLKNLLTIKTKLN